MAPSPTGIFIPGSSRTAVGVVLALLAGLLLVPAPDARSQEEDPENDYRLTIAAQPLLLEPADSLDIKARITNSSLTPLEGFRLRLGITDRVVSRSELHLSYELEPGFEPSAQTFDFKTTVEPGASTTVTLDRPVAEIALLAGATEGGVYPATLVLQDLGGLQNLAAVTTPLIYYPQAPETPLDLVLLVPLNAPPIRNPEGAFPDEIEASLDGLIGPQGRLAGVTAALTDVTTPPPEPEPPPRRRRGRNRPPPREPGPPPVHITLAPVPRLIEELADMADGFPTDDGPQVPAASEVARRAEAWLDSVQGLLTRENVEVAAVPYAFPDLPSLQSNLPLETLAQLTEGRPLLNEILGLDEDQAWLFPPAGRLDTPSLERLQVAGTFSAKVPKIFYSDSSIDDIDDPALAGCPASSPSFTCAVQVDTVRGSTRGFVADAGLSERMTAMQGQPNDRVLLQQFFAETAMIHEELPNVARRVVQATVPSSWAPSPRMARLFFRGLRSSPWIRTRTASEGLASSLEVPERSIVPEAASPRLSPPDDYYTEISEANETVTSYGRIVPPENDRITRLQRNVLVAQSRWWWSDPLTGTGYATRSEAEAEDEMNKIQIQAAQDVTLTSREGDVQFVLTNETTYPVRVGIDIDSPGLELEQKAPILNVYEPGDSPVELKAIAKTSGVFSVIVKLESPNGYEIASQVIRIRSTSYNEVALALTLGALVFLVLFYAVRTIRKRSREDSPEHSA